MTAGGDPGELSCVKAGDLVIWVDADGNVYDPATGEPTGDVVDLEAIASEPPDVTPGAGG